MIDEDLLRQLTVRRNIDGILFALSAKRVLA